MPSSDESFSSVVLVDSLDDFGDDCIKANMVNVNIIDTLDFSEHDSIFIDTNDNPIVCDESSSTYALCTHAMVNGTFYTHAKNSSGGCTVKLYTCQKCKKCGYRANAVYQNTITYAKCPH